METQYDCSDIPDERTELDIAKAIVRQWDNHDKFRVVAGEPNGEPDEVRVARALLRINKEYGCEVRDPCGTIWEHAAKVEAECKSVKALLQEVLDDDEANAGFNANYLDKDLKRRIEEALR